MALVPGAMFARPDTISNGSRGRPRHRRRIFQISVAGDALLRTNSLGDARNILLEAVEKWPADPRFAKPLALLYATFGQGREAVRTLDRHIEQYPEDAEALALAVEWMYHLRLSNAAAYSRAEDQKRARAYADRYAKSKGLQQALVRQWIEYLEKG
jgi:predicted Zn-dependent protease